MKIPRLPPALVLIAILLIVILLGWVLRRDGPPASTAKVTQEAFAVWSEYEGQLEAEQLVLVMSKFRGSATVIDLAPEGARVKRGDVLVQFDTTQLERDVHKLERDEATARSELESLKNAVIPLELRDLEMKIMEARTVLSAEAEYLEASRPMIKEELVSEQELAQQKLKVDQARTQLETLEWKLKLTRTYLHPAALNQARAKLAEAEQDLRFARDQIENSVVRATADGSTVYKPLYVGGEFRMIRIGDTVFPNQTFMALPNVNELTVYVEVPEAELGRVLEGREAAIRLVAFPEIRMEGFVGSVGSIAQTPPGQPTWQRFFHVVVRLKSPAADPRIRPGMTVTVQIRAYFNPRATIVPRTAVFWEGNRPLVRTWNGPSIEQRLLQLGQADDKFYEVIDGLKPGEIVILP